VFMRVLNVSTYRLSDLEQSQFEALALVLCIKGLYYSSHVHKSDMRSLKKLLKCGQEKLSRSIKTAKSLGWIIENNGLIAKPCSDNSENIQFECKNLTLSNVENEIRKLVITNHISKWQKVNSLYKEAKQPKTLKQFKSAKKRLIKWGCQNYVAKGLSYTAFKKELGVSKSKAIELIKELTLDGKILKLVHKKKVFNCFDENLNLFDSFKVFTHRNTTYYQESNYYIIASI
jgi:hypothetical protein